MLDNDEQVYELARELVDTRSVLFLGRHAGYPVALEGALKLKELAYMHAEGFAAGELKHGPIALVEEGMPVFCVVPPQGRDQLHDKMLSGIQEVRARGARTICLAEEGDDTIGPVRRRADLAAPGAGAAPAAGGRRAPAAVRLRAGHGDGPRRRPAAQPGQVRHGRVSPMIVGVGIDVVDIERFDGVARAHARRSGTGCSPPSEAARPPASLAARFAAKEALAKALGAPAGWPGTTPRWSPSPRAARCSRCAAPCWPRADDLGVASVHLSLSHDAGIASAVVVLES